MYKLVETNDKSPSLIFGTEAVSEMMHNSHGAFKESLYIYEGALVQAHQLGLPISIYSLGLGLGYNEWISMGYALKHKLAIKLQTSESEDWLYTTLKQLLELEDSPSHFNEDVKQAMEQVVALVSRHYGLKNKDLIDFAKNLLNTSEWQLHEALNPESLKSLEPVTVIFYDAFSKKMSPQLWEESFLTEFLSHMVAKPGCVFSTYACTGSLKRALKNCSFELIPRDGFEGKRESTLAVKNF